MSRRRRCWHIDPIVFTARADSGRDDSTRGIGHFDALGEKCLADHARHEHAVAVIGSRGTCLNVRETDVLRIAGTPRQLGRIVAEEHANLRLIVKTRFPDQ